MQKEKKGTEEFKQLNIEAISERSADLKSFWNWFAISDLRKDFCKILLFVWAPL